MASDAVSANHVARSYNDTVVKTIDNETLLNANIYDIHQYVENIKKKYVKEDDITLSMGIYGYLGDVNSNVLQNAISMAAEFSNEAIPTKAKFERNIISHALALGINKIYAEPSTMPVMLMFFEEELEINLINNEFILDREAIIYVGDYEFHLPYNMIVRKVETPDGEVIYTAMYDTSVPNPIIFKKSYDVDPYLKPTIRSLFDGRKVVIIMADIRQYNLNKVSRTILTKNPLDSKSMQFEFKDQLAGFDVYVKEYGREERRLTPIYSGLNTQGSKDYCSYTYIDSNTIRITFDGTSYIPTANTEVTVNVYTCDGSKGNIRYNESIYFKLVSKRFNYDRLNVILSPIAQADYGTDRKSIQDLKKIIPKEALARGSVTNSTDINNYFNDIEERDNKIFFFKKMDNPLARLYYAFMLMGTDRNIIPTNTISLNCIRRDFDNISESNYILSAGNSIRYNGGYGSIMYNATSEDKKEVAKNEFLYMNPFMCIVNKSPLFVSYYLDIMDIRKRLEFTYINKDSKLQFITNTMRWQRSLLEKRNTYVCTVDIMQNIQADIGIIQRNDPYDKKKATGADVKVVAVFYSDLECKHPYRWAEGVFDSYDENTYTITYKFELPTNNKVDKEIKLNLSNVHEMKAKADKFEDGFMPAECGMKLFIYSKHLLGNDAGVNKTNLMFADGYLDGYSICNEYTVKFGINFLYNYSDLIESHIKVAKNADGQVNYIIDRVPVIGSDYINTEERIQDFVNELEKRRIHILDCLEVLEDTFGIDIKFFNTYGPSKLFYIDKTTKLNRVNLSIKFRIRFVNNTNDSYLLKNIKHDIRTYIEDRSKISDIHIPNIITYITQKYADNIVFFEFLDFNGYGPGVQHIYRQNEQLVGRIPEFLNINSTNTEDNQLDISIVVS